MEGENYSNDGSIPNKIDDLLITNTEFEEYLIRNKEGLSNKSIVIPESNDMMKSSYLLIDEYGRFLDCSSGGKTPTSSMLDVGVEGAYFELQNGIGKGFDKEMFFKRGGFYPDDWNKNR